MKKIYTQDTLSQFFLEFQKLPDSFKIEQVHHLLNNPNATATHRINFHFNPLKIIIMTSAFIIGVTTLLLCFTPKNSIPDLNIDSAEGYLEPVQRNMTTNIGKEVENYSESANTKEFQAVFNSKVIKESSNEYKNISDESPVNTISNNITFESDRLHPKKEGKISTDENKVLGSDTVARVIDGITLIELARNEYDKLGFLMNDSAIYHFSRNDECVWRIYFTKDVYGCGMVPLSMADTTKPNFIFLSDQNGFQSIKWRCGKDAIDKWNSEYFKTKIQELVPIVLKKSDFPDLLYDNQIFWFEPSTELFNNLPARISSDLKHEYNNLISKSKDIETADISSSFLKTNSKNISSNCNYFESCKSTLALESLKIYPNPAKNSVTVEFNTMDVLRGSILLFSISGSKLRTLVPNSSFLVGQNSYFIELTGIEPGIYLVSINTDKGFKTQRIIVSE